LAEFGARIIRRTYVFPAEIGPVTYREVGLSWGVSAPLFSRILLTTGVEILTGQLLRVVYDLTIAQSPIVPLAKTAPIAGWPVAPSTDTDGQEVGEAWGFDTVDTDGIVVASTQCFEPSSAIYIFLTNCATALAAFPAEPTPYAGTTANGAVEATLNTYESLDFYRIKSGTFETTNSVGADLRSMGMGSGPSDYLAGFRFLFGQAQSKTVLAIIQLNFRVAVGRVLA
jgi:hypothetical protein